MLLEFLLHSRLGAHCHKATSITGECTWPHVDYNLLEAKVKITVVQGKITVMQFIKDVLQTN